MRYGIVIPVHNEADHIEIFVSRFLDEIPPRVRAVLKEVILVENGSLDDTAGACRRLSEKRTDLVRWFSVDRPSYGEAIKQGMLACRCDYLSILEVDFLVPDFVARSIELFEAGQARFVLASKRHPESVDRRPLKRRMLTLMFNWMLNTLVGYPGSDTHGLKSIQTSLAKELCALAETTDEVFQTEIVLLAWRLGHRIEELPIRIEEKRPGPVSITCRLPKVLDMIRQLRRSLKRFPPRQGWSV